MKNEAEEFSLRVLTTFSLSISSLCLFNRQSESDSVCMSGKIDLCNVCYGRASVSEPVLRGEEMKERACGLVGPTVDRSNIRAFGYSLFPKFKQVNVIKLTRPGWPTSLFLPLLWVGPQIFIPLFYYSSFYCMCFKYAFHICNYRSFEISSLSLLILPFCPYNY